MVFKIITWNINGLRSFGGQQQWLKIFSDFDDADIICFQETKISRKCMEKWMSLVENYTSYFSFPDSASHFKSGYSGVASFIREFCRPWAVEVSLFNNTKEIFDYDSFDDIEEDLKFSSKWYTKLSMKYGDDFPATISWNRVDQEGRCVVSKHKIEINATQRWLYVFNLYCPRNDPKRPEREIYQLKFYHLVQKRVDDLLRQSTNHVMILGDFNTAHQSIDVYCDQEFNYVESNSRQWLSEFLNDGSKKESFNKRKLIDAFRYKHADALNEFTCWNNQIGGRETNYGSRIDYIIVDDLFGSHLVECSHLSDYRGSDHCPVMAKFDDRIRFISPPSDHYSQHCTKQWPEFNTQQSGSIRRFLILRRNSKDTNNEHQQDKNPFVREIKSKSKCSQTKISSFLTGIKKIDNEKHVITEAKNEEKSLNSDVSKTETVLSKQSNNASKQWRLFFEDKKVAEVPACSGHQLPCIRRKVRKPGPNYGREFYQCPKRSSKPIGHPETRCDFFRWISGTKTSAHFQQS